MDIILLWYCVTYNGVLSNSRFPFTDNLLKVRHVGQRFSTFVRPWPGKLFYSVRQGPSIIGVSAQQLTNTHVG
jgi:hypothetical protein